METEIGFQKPGRNKKGFFPRIFRGSFPRTMSVDMSTVNLILDFQPPELWKNFYCLKPPTLWYFVIIALEN